jgi:hypothetical protein
MHNRIVLFAILALVLLLPLSGIHAIAGERDGNWIGSIELDRSRDNACIWKTQLKSAATVNNHLYLKIINYGQLHEVKIPISNDGEVNAWVNLDFETRGTAVETMQNEAFKIDGKIEGNYYQADLLANFGRNLQLCRAKIKLAREGTIEAKAFLTGEDPEILRLEKQASGLNAKGQLRRVALKSDAPVDPTKPYDGTWVGVLKNENEDDCRVESKLGVLKVKNFNVEIKTSTGTISAEVSKSGEFSKWMDLEFYNSVSSSTESVNAKLDGSFSTGKFEGDITANLDDGIVCTATLKMGLKGSIHAVALLTGKNPKILRLQRQIAAAQEIPRNDNSVALAEASKITKRRKAEEQRLAQLKDEQAEAEGLAKKWRVEAKLMAEARVKEEAQLAEMRANQKRIAQKQKQEAKQLAEKRKTEKQLMARARVKEEARLAEMRANQKRIAQKQKQEAKQLAEKRKTEEQLMAKARVKEEARLAEMRANQKRIALQQNADSSS